MQEFPVTFCRPPLYEEPFTTYSHGDAHFSSLARRELSMRAFVVNEGSFLLPWTGALTGGRFA